MAICPKAMNELSHIPKSPANSNISKRKLADLQRLLTDLEPYREATLIEVEAAHYKIERLFETLVVTAAQVLIHALAKIEVIPISYENVFEESGKVGLLTQDLAQRLGHAAGMGNILVHLYEQIDYEILHQSIQPALQDFAEFVAIFASDLDVGR